MGAGTGLFLDKLLERLKLFAARHGYACRIEESFEKLEDPIYVVVCRDSYGVAKIRGFLSRSLKGLRYRLLKGVELELQFLVYAFGKARASGIEELKLIYYVDKKRNIVFVGVEEPFRGIEIVGVCIKVVSAQIRKYGERDVRRWLEQMKNVVRKVCSSIRARIFYAIYAPTARLFFDRSRYRDEETFLRKVLYGYGAKLYRSFRELMHEIALFWRSRLERLRDSIDKLKFPIYGPVEKLLKWLEIVNEAIDKLCTLRSKPPPIRDSRSIDIHALLYEARPIDT